MTVRIDQAGGLAGRAGQITNDRHQIQKNPIVVDRNFTHQGSCSCAARKFTRHSFKNQGHWI